MLSMSHEKPIRRSHPALAPARAVLLGLLAGLLTLGCAPSEKPSLTASDPHAQNEWIAEAVKTGDWSAVQGLIELLDSTDPAERLVAIGALRSITGQDHGYRIADPPALRGEAVDRWAAWWIEKQQEENASDPQGRADNDS